MTDKKEMVGPFVRWAGGKTWFTRRIGKYLPKVITDYYEPFLGGGAIFFHLSSLDLLCGDVYLSDMNEDLIQAYIDIRDNCDTLIASLEEFEISPNEYSQIRDLYNNGLNLQKRSAYFIYLNRAGFNGIYRISRAGKYNVPYGGGRGTLTESYKTLLYADSAVLMNTSLRHSSFEYLLDENFHFKSHSLVFLDPPYTVSHNNNGFIAYNRKLFSIDNQYMLRKLLDKIDSEGAYFIMTNANHKVVRDIFDGYYFNIEYRSSVIGGKCAQRGIISEYVICNFKGE